MQALLMVPMLSIKGWVCFGVCVIIDVPVSVTVQGFVRELAEVRVVTLK